MCAFLLPPAMQIVIGTEAVEAVAGKFSGAAGPNGTDTKSLCWYLLKYGGPSNPLRVEMAKHATWMTLLNPLWAATRALLVCCLVDVNLVQDWLGLVRHTCG